MRPAGTCITMTMSIPSGGDNSDPLIFRLDLEPSEPGAS